MTDATLPPREPHPEPDTTDAAESEHTDADDLEPEDAPAMIDEDRVDDMPV